MVSMEKIVLKAQRRDVIGKKVGALRREGKLPAVVYGKHIEAFPITLDLREASRVLTSASSSRLISLEVEGEEFSTLVREKQRHPVLRALLHVDFQAVSLTEKITTMVRVELTGIAPAVKIYNGMVEFETTEVEVECLPQDLPEKISVDISKLKKIGDSIHIRDLSVPQNVEITDDEDKIIVAIISGSIEEVEVIVAGGEGTEPEVLEKGKKEEAED